MTAVAAVLLLLGTATAIPAAAGDTRPLDGTGSPQELLDQVLSCERRRGRCVGIRPLLPPTGAEPASERRQTIPAPTVDSEGTACPQPTLPTPVQDDWCERWVTKRGHGPHGVTEVPQAVAPSTDGSELYVLAHAATSEPLGAAILAFDSATGSWRRTMPIPYRFLGPDSEFYPYLLEANEDSLFVAGAMWVREETPDGFATHTNYLTAAYSLTGELRWWSRYRGPMSGQGPDHGDWPGGLVLSRDGSQVIVTGVSTRPGKYQRDPRFNREYRPDDIATVSYDAATGDELWVERFDSGKLEFTYGVALSPDGGDLYINTMSWQFESRVLAYGGLAGGDPDLAWSHAEDPAEFLAPISIAATSEGPIIAGISLANPSSTIDYGVVALDTVGDVRWRANHSNVYTIAGVDYTSHDLPMGMVTDGDRVYVTGYAFEWDLLYGLGDPSPAMVPSTVAFDARTGSLRWARTYRFPGHRIHFPMSLQLAGDRLYVPGVDSECNFYVPDQGYYCKSTTINLVTLDYAATTGALQRVARYNHARALDIPGVRPSPPTAPGFNLIGPSTAAGERLYVTAYLDAPCLGECLPGGWYRMGILGY